MEVYAGFLEHTDYHTGRVIDAIADLGILEDTLIYVIIGDNGASAEGTLNGAFNEMANFNGMAALETPEFMLSKMDEFGSPESYNHYAVGWAWAMDTPYQWTKAGCFALGRHPFRQDRALAQGHQGEGRPAQPVQPCDRCCPHDSGSGGHSRAGLGKWGDPITDGRYQHDLQLQPGC